MKSELLKLYTGWINKFNETVAKLPNDKLHGPFLMSPSESYNRQPNKLLVIGQETIGWSAHYGEPSKQMDQYEEFNLGIKYKSTPFWSVMRKLENALGNDPYSSAWTNLNRFDQNGTRPHGEGLEAISKLDSLLIDELKITNPDYCIFFTGPDFDHRIQTIFKDAKFSEIPGFEYRQFCKISHPELPKECYRAYHPRALRMQKIESRFIDYFKS